MDDDMKTIGRSRQIKMNKKSKLGQGAYGSVYKGHHKTSGPCAVKRIEIDEKNELASKNFSKELNIIKSSSHPNMVRYLFDDEDDNFYYIAMELCTRSLSDYFKLQGYGAFNCDFLVTRVMHQCTSGVEYLHGKDIMHKDIKPANMLMSESSNRITINLADFGMCKVLDPNKSSTVSSTKGSLGYNASEVILEQKNKCESDIFSLGISFHEFSARGRNPFGGNDRLKAELDIKLKKEPDLSEVAKKPFGYLITETLNHHWQKRPKAEEVLIQLRKLSGNDDKLGEPIKRSSLYMKKPTTSNENKDCSNKDVTNAGHRLAYATADVALLKADPLGSEGIPLPPKRLRMMEAQDTSINVQKDNSDIWDKLENARSSIRRSKWNEANDFLDCAVKLLEPMGSVTAQYLSNAAVTASSKSSYVKSILLYVCSASQYRKEKIYEYGSFHTSQCLLKICQLTKNALNASDTAELSGSNVRYKDVAEYFVIPLVTRECEKLKQFGEEKNVMKVAAVQHNAFVISWLAELFNLLGQHEKAAEIAEDARRRIESFSSDTYQVHVRLLQEEGKAKIQLKKHDEARDLLNDALAIASTHDSQSVVNIKKSIEDNKLKATT